MTTSALTMQGVVGKRKESVVDALSVVGEVSGLEAILVVIGRVVTLEVVGSDVVVTVEVSIGMVLSTVMVVLCIAGCILGVVSVVDS